MSLSVTPQLIIAAAQKRGWNARIIDESTSFYRLDLPDGRYYFIRNITSDLSSRVAGIIADRKELFYTLISEMGIQTPDTMVYKDNKEVVEAFLDKHKTIVVKPSDSSHGNGVTVGITTYEKIKEAVTFASEYSKLILLQQQVEGDDYRVLMMGGDMVAAAIRKPGYVIGDGVHTVSELIDIENSKPTRTTGYGTMLTMLNKEAAGRYLADAISTVPDEGQEVRVIGTANIGKGGVAIDITDEIHPDIITAAEKVSEYFKMNICGVDFIVTEAGAAYMIEINTGPSLGLHEYPYKGVPRQTQEKFLDLLSTHS